MNSASHAIHPAASQLVAVSLIAGGLALLTGCGSYPEEHIVAAPPPAVVAPATQQVIVTQPAATVATAVTATPLANGQLIISQAPPAAVQTVVVDARPPQPSENHVWIEGYWAWREDRYQWVGAHWQERPYPNAHWIAPRWESRNDGNYTFYEGYWN